MNHKQLKLLVSSFIDNELTKSEKSIVKEHIKECSECRTFIDNSYRIRKDIRMIGDTVLSNSFAARVRNIAVHQAEQSEKWLGIEHLVRNTVFVMAFAIIIIFFVTSNTNETLPGISEVLIDGSGNDSTAAQVLLHPGDLSKNDFLYVVMVK